MADTNLPFHPVIENWFRARFGAPTDAQRLGWPEISAGRHALIAAPTGSGKTLAAFLACLDRLFQQGLAGPLPDQVQVVYVSPLKALSADIHRNLEVPLAEIAAAARAAGLSPPGIRARVRTGDTPPAERQAMLKKPPHILVTTPESLYLLLTSAQGRKALRTTRTVIVDEIHALARDKRGTHFSLTLERLEALCGGPLQRIGLSATQKPMDEIARFLASNRPEADVRVIDLGHVRELDLAVEAPESELSAVCSNEQWAEVHRRLVDLVRSHRSTLIFVNTRRMAERIGYRLSELLGEGAVASHHGSLSRDIRLSAEERLKSGKLKAIVATASLEMGIDVGFIDLVCQIGSPRSIAGFLQRVGRSGHSLGVTPKGRLFALSRDELLECFSLLRAVRAGRLDRVEIPGGSMDVLVQQVVAAASCEDWEEDRLYELCRRAWPYRDLTREDFEKALRLAAEGVAPARREGAYLHRDRIHGTLTARRSARLAALTSGGAIPETADYRVVTAEDRAFVGTVNEDFAIESLAGDVFLLGNTSWRIHNVRGGEVAVSDAGGAPATIPFWLGEAPGRTVELSAELSDLREGLAERSIDDGAAWLEKECGAALPLARQAAEYVAAQKAAVGFVPTRRRLLFERFFDDSGGMQLIIHSPYGARINRAWGLAMRKKFCRTFDFELQASADDNGISLSLGPQHSFPLEDMFKMVRRDNAEETLVQALLAAPVFQIRWRWNLTRALAVLRMRGGKKVPPPLQRFKADDLLTAVFPLQTACFEHRPPDVPIPDHPLVAQTVHDCLHEAMDLDRWRALLADIEEGRVVLEARDTREPSPFSYQILNANPYAFLDDAPLEERRARALAVRRALPLEELRDLSKLDPEAVARVKSEAWPLVRDAEELHDALLSLGVLPAAEGEAWRGWFDALRADGRAVEVALPDGGLLWAAAEGRPLVQAAYPGAVLRPDVPLPDALEVAHEFSRAVAALARGRMGVSGPVTAEELARVLHLGAPAVQAALESLEAEGAVLRGRWSGAEQEWCERRMLARIHRLSVEGARRRVRPVSPEDFWRFLAAHQRVRDGKRAEGRGGLRDALEQLQGFELPAGAWEADVLSARLKDYEPLWLDELSFSGEAVWGRLSPPAKAGEDGPSGSPLTRVVPIALMMRRDLPWLLPPNRADAQAHARPPAKQVLDCLRKDGALFAEDLAAATGLLPVQVEEALSELAALGLATADGFASIRGLLTDKGRVWDARRRRRGLRPRGGRWTLFPGRPAPVPPEERVRRWAGLLLRRYGVVFKDLLGREEAAPAWWELIGVYRRMEARGEIQGGRFVAGVSGEQYALPEAVEPLRHAREEAEEGWLVISAADPLNLAGLWPDVARVPALRGNRILFHGGKPVALYQGGEASLLETFSPDVEQTVRHLLRLDGPASLRDEILAELRQKTR